MDNHDRMELAARLEAENAESLRDIAERRAAPLLVERRDTRPWHERGLTVATMDGPTFSEWVDAGKPSLEKRKAPDTPALAPVAVKAIGEALSHERAAMRAHVEKRLADLTNLMGEEVGRMQRELKDQLRREMELLQAAHELALREMRAELLAGDDAALPRFLPGRRADASH